MPAKTRYPEAIPAVIPLNGDAGPCQIEGCSHRATVRVVWAIIGYGDALAWYCDDHRPPSDA